MTKKLKLLYSSNRNITFNNRNSPDYVELPDDWEEYTQFDKDKYIDEVIQDYLWDLVDVCFEEVDADEGADG